MKTLRRFSIGDYLASRGSEKNGIYENDRFFDICLSVKTLLEKDFERQSVTNKENRILKEKGAIIGHARDVAFFKEKIRSILTQEKWLSEPYPNYYPDLTEAVFDELYGLSCIAPWAFGWTEELKRSSSAKIIGENIYYMIDGEEKLQPMKISDTRRAQLRRNLLLATPKERSEYGFHEVYLENGTRVTIFSGDRTKPGQDSIVFRKYLLQHPSLEVLEAYGTFPRAAMPLFKSMIEIGYNVVFTGRMRSGKTTFLQAWQAGEDKKLEGVTIATDPETSWNRINPGAPIIQLVADGERLLEIEKSIKRSDADYVILEEMRDAVGYQLFLQITSLGTLRSKGTIHARSAANIPQKMASAIATRFHGDKQSIIADLFENINYVIELYEVPENKARKRVKSISELRYDPYEDSCSIHEICKYHPDTDSWSWKYDIGPDKEDIALGYTQAFNTFKTTLKALEEESPIKEDTVIYPKYYQSNRDFLQEGRIN